MRYAYTLEGPPAEPLVYNTQKEALNKYHQDTGNFFPYNLQDLLQKGSCPPFYQAKEIIRSEASAWNGDVWEIQIPLPQPGAVTTTQVYDELWRRIGLFLTSELGFEVTDEVQSRNAIEQAHREATGLNAQKTIYVDYNQKVAGGMAVSANPPADWTVEQEARANQLASRQAEIARLEGKANELYAMNPIPDDFENDKYWVGTPA